jgi:hypothetical protein
MCIISRIIWNGDDLVLDTHPSFFNSIIFCSNKIRHLASYLNTPQQNGSVEQKNR